jgi:hypothetical protein
MSRSSSAFEIIVNSPPLKIRVLRLQPCACSHAPHQNELLIRLRVDHVISADEKRRWNRYTNRLSRLQVDKKLKFRGLLNRQIGEVCSFEDPEGLAGSAGSQRNCRALP